MRMLQRLFGWSLVLSAQFHASIFWKNYKILHAYMPSNPNAEHWTNVFSTLQCLINGGLNKQEGLRGSLEIKPRGVEARFKGCVWAWE